MGSQSRHSLSITVAVLVVGCISTFLFSINQTRAQSFGIGGNGLSLVMSPEFPKPYGTVEVSVDDYSIDTLGSTITWYVDGEELSGSKNERSVTLDVGGLGEKSEVSVLITNPKMPAFSAAQSIIPVTIDTILEADTYVPAFYKGRALPSREATVRALAVVHDGTEAPDTRYTYKWTLNDSVLYGGPVTGKNVAEFTMPRYDGARLTVDVFNKDSVRVGRQSFLLKPAELEMHFYENSTLRGLSQKEIGSSYALTKDEINVFAEPYFMNTNTITQSFADVTWKINGMETGADAQIPNAITLKRVGEAGDALIECSIVTKSRIPQYVTSSFQAFFQ